MTEAHGPTVGGPEPTTVPALRPSYPRKMRDAMEGVEPVPFATRIWDVLLVHGPLKDDAKLVRLAAPMVAAAWKEYQRYHPEYYGKDGNSTVWEIATREYVTRALEHGVRRGWLLLDEKGLYTAAVTDQLPDTSWTPLSDRGRTSDRTTLTVKVEMPISWQPEISKMVYADHGLGVSDLQLIDVMRKLRAEPDTAAKAALKESLRTVGQLYPIIRWRPNTALDTPWIIIDGVTREDLLLKICAEEKAKQEKGRDFAACEPIKYMDLPHDMPIIQVFAMKVAAEMSGSTKTKDAIDRFLVSLADQGLPHEKISKIVGRGRSQVTKLLNAAGIARKGKIEQHKDEILALYARGLTVREIAEEVGFAKSTVHDALDAWVKIIPVRDVPSSHIPDKDSRSDSDGSSETSDPVPTPAVKCPLPRPSSKVAIGLYTFVTKLHGEGNERDVYTTARLEQANIAGGFNTWLGKGWVDKTNDTKPYEYRATPILLELFDAYPEWVDEVRGHIKESAPVKLLPPAPHPEPIDTATDTLVAMIGRVLDETTLLTILRLAEEHGPADLLGQFAKVTSSH